MSKDATIAARVPLDLRADLELVAHEWRRAGVTYPDGRPADLSYVIRLGTRRLADEAIVRRDGEGRDPTRPGEVRPPGELAGDPSASVDALRLLPGNGNTAVAVDLDNIATRAHRNDPATAKSSAEAVAPRAGSQRRIVLEAFERAGNRGLTADEADHNLACRATVAAPWSGQRRTSELLKAGLLEPRTDRPQADDEEVGDGLNTGGDTVTRRTRSGHQATVYRITGDGLLALTRKRREEANR